MGELNINDCVRELKQDLVKHLRNERDRFKRKIKAAEANFLAKCLLGEAGITLYINKWYPNEAEIVLENAKQLPAIRRALDVPLKPTGRKDLVHRSKNRVWVYMSAEGFPGLTIRYKAVLKDSGPCKVIKRKRTYNERVLVCSTR